MLKFAIYTSLLLTVILHTVIAAEDNSLFNDAPAKKLLVTSIYESLYSAIEMDSADEVKQFISFGADVNHRYKGAVTPLMLATSIGSIDAVNALLELGANPNLTSTEEMTAMDYAIKSGDDLIVTVLKTHTLSAKADPEIILIRKIQFLLGRLGYDAGEVDGDYGKRTKQSLENFTIDTKQVYSAELSNRQVESLKNVFFNQALKKVITSTDKKSNNSLDVNTEKEIETIKAISMESSSESTTKSDGTAALSEN